MKPAGTEIVESHQLVVLVPDTAYPGPSSSPRSHLQIRSDTIVVLLLARVFGKLVVTMEQVVDLVVDTGDPADTGTCVNPLGTGVAVSHQRVVFVPDTAYMGPSCSSPLHWQTILEAMDILLPGGALL